MNVSSKPTSSTKAKVIQGDCLEELKKLPDNSVDSIVTDPPYGLSDQKQADVTACLTAWLAGQEYKSKKKGFMGKSWDAWVPGPEVWKECYRVLKPGGHVLTFSGTRTQDLMGISLRLAGFEIRDTIAWVYGSGFPKSLDVSKAIDKAAGAEGKYEGAKTAAHASRKSLNVPEGWDRPWMANPDAMNRANSAYHPATDAAKAWEGWGTALKPALEPIILTRKPLDGTVAANVLKHGTGALNIDGGRIGVDPLDKNHRNPLSNDSSKKSVFGIGGTGCLGAGRWPANLIHDGSDEVTDLLGDSARFFYCSKASKKDREEGLNAADGTRANNHPTVKPTDLMRYLVRLITPPNGTVLDPFAGSGSTGKAAMLEGFSFIGIELDENYATIAQKRIDHAKEKRNGESTLGT